jgi:hypothetical protein
VRTVVVLAISIPFCLIVDTIMHLPSTHGGVANGLTAICPEVWAEANIQGGSNCRLSNIWQNGTSAEGVSLTIDCALGQLLL